MMDPNYVDVQRSKDWSTYRFVSEGQNGVLQKIVQFKRTGKRGIYLLGMGDALELESSADFKVRNHSQRDDILATVAMTVFSFLDRYPRRAVFFQGSTPARNRLYRMMISKALEELEERFEVEGLLHDGEGQLRFQRFAKENDFKGFLVRRPRILENAKPPP